MVNTNDFEEIRPYCDEEVKDAIERIIHNGTFAEFVKNFFQTKNMPRYLAQLRNVETVHDFQEKIIYPLTTKLIDRTTNGLSTKGLKYLDPQKKYLFISNHRDIILDSALINHVLFQNGFPTTEIAIGSNLLIKPWIVDLVKLNKSFVVNRSSSARQMLLSSKILSRYIRSRISNNTNSVWIAQREGRTKDGNDSTQHSLLKMLNMSGDTNTIESFLNLNIVPVSISYEYEPCDTFKTRELYLKNSTNGYQKTQEDDLKSMFSGLVSNKGCVHLHFSKPINHYLEKFPVTASKNKVIGKVAEIIDYRIHKNFKLWTDNYVAYEALHAVPSFAKKFTEKEKKRFFSIMKNKLSGIEGDLDTLRSIFFGIYANPIINKINLKKPQLHES